MIPDRPGAARGAGRGRRRRLAAVRLPRAQSGGDAGARADAGSTPGGCSCCCRARESRSRWRTGSSCRRSRGSPGGSCRTRGGRSCTRRSARWCAGQRLAMEISPEDAVPYLDRVPFGVVELLRRLGATIVPSGAAGDPVRRAAGRRRRRRTTAPRPRCWRRWRGRSWRAAVRRGRHAGSPRRRCRRGWWRRCEARGLVFDTLPIVGFGPNSANPALRAARRAGRDAPAGARWCCSISGRAGAGRRSSPTRPGWASPAAGLPAPGGSRCGRRCGARGTRRWPRSRAAAAAGRPIAGFEADRAARGVVEAAGLRRARSCTGPGTRSTATCTARGRTSTTTRPTTTGGWCRASGSRWSPGSICPGEFGVRSEVNMYWGDARAGGDAARAAAGADRAAGVGTARARALPLPKLSGATLESRPSASPVPVPSNHASLIAILARSRRRFCSRSAPPSDHLVAGRAKFVFQ